MFSLKFSGDFYRETTLAMLNQTRRHDTERRVKWRDWAILLGLTGHLITVLIVALYIKHTESEPSVAWYLEPALSVGLQYRKFLLSVLLVVTSFVFHSCRLLRHYPIYRFGVGHQIYDMLVTNYQHFQQSLLVDDKLKHFGVIKYWWQVVYRRKHFDWIKFSNSKLAHLQYISTRFRFRSALWQQALSLGICLLQLLFCKNFNKALLSI